MKLLDSLITVNVYVSGTRLGSGLGNIKPPKSTINQTDLKLHVEKKMLLYNAK